MTLYDKIGSTYNLTRKADKFITNKIYELLSPDPLGLYLDIGCGTGNYLKALTDKGLTFYGIDPSETMLLQAKEKNPQTNFIKANSENIPLPDNHFNGAIAILTIHHWENILTGLNEINRVLKPNAKLVLFSFTPEQMRGYWLYHYFPRMIETCMKQIPDLKTMEKLFTESGFSHLKNQPYFIQPDLEDHFLYSNKHSPEQYLSEQIRNNSSGFRVLAEPEEVKQGVQELEKDIQTGKINSVITKYENDLGDYLFLSVTK